MPTTTLHGKIHFTTLHNKEPEYHSLITFGLACFPCLRPYWSNKFDFHTQKCVFLGYSGNHKGYRFLSPTGRIYTSKHVCFNEQDFLFSTNFLHNPPVANNEPPSILSWLPIPQYVTTLSNSSHTIPALSTTTMILPTLPTPPPQPHLPITPLLILPALCPSTQYLPHRRPFLIFLSLLLTHPNLTPTLCTRGKVNISKPKHFFGCLSHITPKIAWTQTKPQRFSDDVSVNVWHRAMAEEFAILTRDYTWELIPPNPHQHLVGNKWVFKFKQAVDSSILRYKARLVAKGFSQTPGIDFHETYSLVTQTCHHSISSYTCCHLELACPTA